MIRPVYYPALAVVGIEDPRSVDWTPTPAADPDADSGVTVLGIPGPEPGVALSIHCPEGSATAVIPGAEWSRLVAQVAASRIDKLIAEALSHPMLTVIQSEDHQPQ